MERLVNTKTIKQNKHMSHPFEGFVGVIQACCDIIAEANRIKRSKVNITSNGAIGEQTHSER